MSLRLAIAGGLLVGLVGCVAQPSVSLPERLPPMTGISEAALHGVVQPRSPDELLALNDEMRAFVARSVDRRAPRDRRIRQLTSAVLHPGTLGLTYLDRKTRSAEEAFSTASGNCLTLSMLFVALAREAGIEAQFYEVDVVPEWTLAGDIVFATRHINVGGQLNSGATYVMDFSPYIARREIGRKRLSDHEAIAQYYNNIGAEFLAAGELVSAFRQFEAGLSLAPRISYLWSNLAVVYSRNRQPDAAESALQIAIALDPGNTSAMANLAHVLDERGDRAAAAALGERIARAQQDNPYYQFALGERHLAASRYAEALAQIMRAIDLQPREPLFYKRASAAARQLGDSTLVAQFDAKAARLGAEEQARRRSRLRF